MIEEIIHNTVLYAIIIRSQFKHDGIKFFTPNDFSQQLAYMKHQKGHAISPHLHNPVPREITYTKEVLLIRSGKVRVDIFDNEQTYLESRILETGDTLLLADGGHGFEMLEETEMIEIKQGPYLGDETDKTRFSKVVSPIIKGHIAH